MITLHIVPKALCVICMTWGLFAPSVKAHINLDVLSDAAKLPTIATERSDERTRFVKPVTLSDRGLAAFRQPRSILEWRLDFQKLGRIIGPDKKAADEEFPWPLPTAP